MSLVFFLGGKVFDPRQFLCIKFQACVLFWVCNMNLRRTPPPPASTPQRVPPPLGIILPVSMQLPILSPCLQYQCRGDSRTLSHVTAAYGLLQVYMHIREYTFSSSHEIFYTLRYITYSTVHVNIVTTRRVI